MPEKKEIKLKPCPFCGQGVKHYIREAGWMFAAEFIVGCYSESCFIRPNSTAVNKEDAIIKWNTRRKGVH